MGQSLGSASRDRAAPYQLEQSSCPISQAGVDGIDAAKARVEKAGGQITNGPMEVPGGIPGCSWIIHGRDPQDVEFALVAPRR
jgi:predicted enzyme related to lactoylglutathione lyase